MLNSNIPTYNLHLIHLIYLRNQNFAHNNIAFFLSTVVGNIPVNRGNLKKETKTAIIILIAGGSGVSQNPY